MKIRLTICMAVLFAMNAAAQNPAEDKIKTTGLPLPRQIINSDIPGAPVLLQPQLIDGNVQEIRTEKHGLIYPAFFDWNRDGKKDLLLGEFETGQTGSYIKVYLNEGTDNAPEFSGEYFYATDVKGDTITNFQWCCIGIHPRILDFDGDGYQDILSGQYNPGAISLWRGSKNGFLPREFVEQEGFIDSTIAYRGSDPSSPESNTYWNYTSADFGDFNGDGLIDLFVGGSGGPRVALNTGTKQNPKFGLRKYLEYAELPLSIDSRARSGYEVSYGKSYITPVDWDNDGILDILMTHEYTDYGQNPIEFFKGVQTPGGLCFEKPVALFYAEKTTPWGHILKDKAFPGCQPMITVVDYNNDGVLDIVIGISIPTINGFEAAPEVAWEWAHTLGIQTPGKDAGRQLQYNGGIEGTIKKIEENPLNKRFYLGNLDDYKYLTLRHRGYVFVMYGSENPTKAKTAVTGATMGGNNTFPNTKPSSPYLMTKAASGRDNTPPDTKPSNAYSITRAATDRGNNTQKIHEQRGPVSFTLELPENIKPGEHHTTKVTFSFEPGWHGYPDNKATTAQGFIATKAEFLFPDGVKAYVSTSDNGSVIYEGEVSFNQPFSYNGNAMAHKNELPVTIKLQWQVCDENMCLSPENVTIEKTIKII